MWNNVGYGDTGHTYRNTEYNDNNKESKKKGKFLNSLKKYYIFLASKQEIHMNEFNVDHSNPIYETMYQKLKKYPHRQQHTNLPHP
jgi:DNA mismatch repair ATPase MutL